MLGRLEYSEPSLALRTLLSIDNALYRLISLHAIRYGFGNHVKHRLTGYIRYFVSEALERTGPYLDIGCAVGEISGQIAIQSQDRVVGIDISQKSITEANRRFKAENLEFICGDANDLHLAEHFETIIMSNVLEHIDKRETFLIKIKKRYQPSALLIRVPNYERDWRVPLKEEMGVSHLGDPTHYIEHRPDELRLELSRSGFEITKMRLCWGEIWVTATPIVTHDS